MLARSLAVIAASLIAAPSAFAASAPDAGMPFEPAPSSQALYGTKTPADDEATQQHVVEAADGTDLFVETWLPAAKDGQSPPAKVPTILIMTPYVQEGSERYPSRNLEPVIAYFTARGYAVAQHHVRGTGNSGGCLEQTSTNQIDDGARVVEYLGRDAPWSNGSVGMYGISYDAETQISVAGRGDPEKIKYLKAITPSETVAGQYEYSNMDGVPFIGQALLSNTGYLALTSLAPGEAPTDEHTFERFGCQPELFAGSADMSGDMTDFWRVREYRPELPKVTAATLWLHGTSDWNVLPISMAASFDRIPATTPKKAIVGVFEHNYPDKHAGVSPDWARQDWLPSALAWFDRYLKGASTGVEDWPEVQVQDSTGQWRAEPGWPWTGGPVGHLGLGPDGALGVAAGSGSTEFVEGPDDEETVEGSRAVFETPALAAPLHLTGQAVADLWIVTDRSDAHLTAQLQVLGADGEPIVYSGSDDAEVGTFGARSLRHLDPMPDGYFVQAEGKAAPTGEPLRVPIRFQPNDFVVPAGGKLRMTIAGGTARYRETEPSGNGATIEILHDCEHRSALRFLMPRATAPQLNVRETDEAQAGPLPANPAPALQTDGGGLATWPLCGHAPERLAEFHGPGDERPAIPGQATAAVQAPGTAAPIARPAPVMTKLGLKVFRTRLRTALRRGLRVRLLCSGECSRVAVTAAPRGRRARRAVGRRRAASRRVSVTTGRRTLRLKFSRKVRKRLVRREVRRLALTVRLSAAGAMKTVRVRLR